MTRRGKWLCGLLALLLLLPAGCGAREAVSGGPAVHGQLAVADGALTDAEGRPFQLRGMSTHGIAWYPQYLNEEAFLSVKEAGGNVIRVAMYTDTENGYLVDPETNLARVMQAIELARTLDLYIVVDWHILSDGNPETNQAAAIDFFHQVASRYPDDPAILYEICNEPNGVEWNVIQAYADAVFPVIRQHSPHAVIILGTPNYSGDLRQPMLRPFSGENFLYSYHFYAGQHTDYSFLNYALEQHMPVMVSEWGVSYGEDGAPAVAEGQEFVAFLNEKGVSWCAWSLCNKDEVYSVLRPDCEALGGWQTEDLTDVGRMVFAALQGSME